MTSRTREIAQPGMSEGAVAWVPFGPAFNDLLAESWRDLCEYDDRTSPEEYPDMCLINQYELSLFMHNAIATFAAPQSEPLPGGAGEADRLIAVRDALLVAGGADPSNGVCRFSYWNLDKLNKAFDAALASLSRDTPESPHNPGQGDGG